LVTGPEQLDLRRVLQRAHPLEPERVAPPSSTIGEFA
jgi:hypothetical protein